MNLILKSSGSDFILPDVGVLIANAGSDFSGIPGLIRALGQSVGLRERVLGGTVVVNNGTSDLSATAGQQYLNQLWLQSGHDIRVQMEQIESVISDIQHGSRSGGTLHSAAVAGVAGFISASDKAKLDGLSASFGSFRGYNSDDTETTYAGTAYQQKVRLAAAIPAAGTYRIEWYLELRNSESLADDMKARAQVDDTTTLFEVNLEAKDITNYMPISGFIELTLAVGTRNIDLDYAGENAADDIIARRGRLSIFRVT